MWPMNGYFQAAKAAAANMPPSGEKGSYTAEMFQGDFPQFTTTSEDETISLVPDALLQIFLDQANDSVLPSRWGNMWRYAAGLYMAHFSAMYLKTYAPGSSGTAQAAASAQPAGVVKSAAMGDTTISYDNSAVTGGMEKWGTWNSTQYGQQLVTMARMVGMGGAYVI